MIPILSTPVTYEPKLQAPFDKRMLFENMTSLQNYDTNFMYAGWIGYVKGNNYHVDTPGSVYTYDGTTYVGIGSDTVDGKHAYGTPVGDYGVMVDPTNLIEYISKLRSLIKKLDTTDDLLEGLTNLYFTKTRVLSTELTGFISTTGSVNNTDTVISAIQKLVGNSANYVSTTDPRLSDARIASDVYSWAKASTKPTYTYTEVGAAASSHTHITSGITALTGYALGTNSAALATTDTLNIALAKLQVQINNKQSSGNYEPLITKSTGYAKYVSGAWSFINETYSLSTHEHSSLYQPIGNYVLTNDSRLNDARTPLAHVHYQLYKPDGTSAPVYVDSAGKLHVDADIITNGGSYKTYSEEIYSDTDYITMRNGATAGLANGAYSGFLVKKYDGVNDGRLVVGNDGFARVGDVGQEQILTTRTSSPTDGYLAYWDNANLQLGFKLLSKIDVGLGNVDNTADVNKNVLTSTKLNSSKTFALTGDVTASLSSDLSSGLSLTTTISTSALLAKLLTGYTIGSNATLSTTDSLLVAFGKIQAQLNAKQNTGSYVLDSDSRLTNARPASDVYTWAKQTTKPSYTYTEVGAASSTHNHDTIYQPLGTYLTNTDLSNINYGLKIGANEYTTSSQVFIPFFKFGSEIASDGNYTIGKFISTRGSTKLGVGNTALTIIDFSAKNSIWQAGYNNIKAYFNVQITPSEDATGLYFATALLNGELWFGFRFYSFQYYTIYFSGESSNTLTPILYKKTYGGEVIYNQEINDSITKYTVNTQSYRNGNKIWHEGNDGANSGLDADLLDGKHASEFSLTTHSHNYLPLSGGSMSNNNLVDELNAEYLNGHPITDFSLVGHTHNYLSLDGGTMNNSNLVTSLNAELLGGKQASDFSLTTHVHTGVYEPAFTSGTTSQYRRGDKTWQTLDKTAVGLGNVENTTLSTWTGSTNIVNIGTLSSLNINKTSFKYSNIEISISSHDWYRSIILLHPAYDGVNPIINNYCIGRFIGQRGGTVSTNRRWIVDVNSATAYNTNIYGTNSFNGRATLATTLYGGVKYVCLILPYSATKITSISFEGYINSSATEKLKFIEYYDAQNNIVLDTDVNTNLTNLTSFKDQWWDISNLYVNGSKVWTAGNDGTGSTLDADLLDGLEATAFSLSTHTHSGVYQPIDADLTAIAALGGTSGLLKKTASDTWTLDTNSYLQLSGGTLTGNLILNADPTVALGAVTKQYVDNAVQGITIYTPCRLGTTGSNITLSGGAPNTLDGITLVLNDRILVKNQTDKTQNGIYYVTTVGTGTNGTWTRATDADTSGEVKSGAFVLITNGDTLSGNGYSITTPAPITLGTSQIILTQYSQAGVYTNGTGLTKTGNTFAIDSTVATLSNAMTFTNKTWNGVTIGIAYGGTGATTKTAAFDALSPLISVGDVLCHNGTNNARIPGNTTNTLMLLGSMGTGSVAQLPAWYTITKSTIGLNLVDNTSDANKPISTATQSALDGKEPSLTAGLTTDYYAGDKTWKPLTKSAIGLSLVDNTSDITKSVASANKLTSSISFALTGDVIGSINSDLSSNISITTSVSNSSVISKVLTGYVVGSNSALVATDSILTAFGKLESKINSKIAGITANTPLYINGTSTNPTINIYRASSSQNGFMTSTQYKWYLREITVTNPSDNTFTLDWSTASKVRMGVTNSGTLVFTNISIGELSLELHIPTYVVVNLPSGWWVNGSLTSGVNMVTFQWFGNGFGVINIAKYNQIQ